VRRESWGHYSVLDIPYAFTGSRATPSYHTLFLQDIAGRKLYLELPEGYKDVEGLYTIINGDYIDVFWRVDTDDAFFVCLQGWDHKHSTEVKYARLDIRTWKWMLPPMMLRFDAANEERAEAIAFEPYFVSKTNIMGVMSVDTKESQGGEHRDYWLEMTLNAGNKTYKKISNVDDYRGVLDRKGYKHTIRHPRDDSVVEYCVTYKGQTVKKSRNIKLPINDEQLFRKYSLFLSKYDATLCSCFSTQIIFDRYDRPYMIVQVVREIDNAPHLVIAGMCLDDGK
jgi:hypothetical protein